MNLDKVRTYEVSVWTLQDSMITVLKYSNMEIKGQLQNAKLTKKDDGTEEFSFSIPMYYSVGTERVENPLWYNTQDGTFLVNLHKIKVIINKKLSNEAIFEFIITKVTERHQGDVLTCDVKCEGLAFHELGKIGYKISLNENDFYDDYNMWLDYYKGDSTISADADQKWHNIHGDLDFPPPPEEEEYIANIDYWMEKICPPNSIYNAWTWSVQMDWADYDGTVLVRKIDGARVQHAYVNRDKIGDAELIVYGDIPSKEQRATINGLREKAGYRRYDKIYEDPIITNWAVDTQNENRLISSAMQNETEKARLMNKEESNIYNLTQELAKVFGVYCRYEYTHDDSYHITSREIVFYNNFVSEEQGALDLTYKYQTNEISREMDGTDIVSKLFVRPIQDSTMPGGLISISETEANPSMEDYLLDFDYLYKIKNIMLDQYYTIPKYEKEMRLLNQAIKPLELKIINLQTKENELKAKIAFHEKAIKKDIEQISQSDELLKSITNGSDEITIGGETHAPKYTMTQGSGTGDTYQATIRKLSDLYESDRVYGLVSPATAILMLADDKEKENNTSVYYFRPPYKGFYMNKPTVILSDGYDAVQHVAFTQKYAHEKKNGRIEYANSLTTYKIPSDDIELETDIYGNIKRVLIKNLSFDANESKRIFYSCKYKPILYYQRIKETWEDRLALDQKEKAHAEELLKKVQDDDEEGLTKLTKDYNDLLRQKRENVARFEKLMGSALREGYWQPEDYFDFGERYAASDDKETKRGLDDKHIYSALQPVSAAHWNKTATFNKDAPMIQFGWDEPYFTGEDDISYEITVNQDGNPYYGVFLDNYMTHIPTMLQNLSTLSFCCDRELKTSNSSTYRQRYVVGSTCEFGFVFDTTLSQIRPVLILTGFSMEGRTSANNCSISFFPNSSTEQAIVNNVTIEALTNCIRVYPRIRIGSLKMKNSSDLLKVYYNVTNSETTEATTQATYLKRYQDYSVLAKPDGYYLTIKPEAMFALNKAIPATKDNTGNNKFWSASSVPGNSYFKPWNVMCTISNADTMVYVDAKKVMHESSMPRVSYNINLSIYNANIVRKTHKLLNNLVHVNDPELKFDNVLGYVSEINMDLDHPWKDKIVIKNYKTGFEDLFSNIVAQTEAMEKASGVIDSISGSFNANGGLTEDALFNSIGDNYNYFDDYIDTSTMSWQDILEQYFHTAEWVQDQLNEVWVGAQEISSEINSAADELNDIVETATSTFNDLTKNIEQDINALKPTLYTGNKIPDTAVLKTGDIWDTGTTIQIYMGGKWVTTSNQDSSKISGAQFTLDAANGIIDMSSGGYIQLLSSSLMLIGNQNIDIGSRKINIGSAYYLEDGVVQDSSTDEDYGGIHLTTAYINKNRNAEGNIAIGEEGDDIATGGNGNTMSTVDITGKGIKMKSSEGIKIESGKGILIGTVDPRGTSDAAKNAMQLDSNGIYIGSNKGITLYTTTKKTTNGVTTSTTSAAVEMKGDHIIFGVSGAKSSSVVKITKNKIIAGIITVAATTDNPEPTTALDSVNLTGEATALVGTQGLKIDSNGLGFSSSSQENAAVILMNQNGITIGTVMKKTSSGSLYYGAAIKLKQNRFEVTSNGHVVITTNNILINTTGNNNNTTPIGIGDTNAGATIAADQAGDSSLATQFAIGTNLLTSTPNVQLALIGGTLYIKDGITIGGDIDTTALDNAVKNAKQYASNASSAAGRAAASATAASESATNAANAKTAAEAAVSSANISNLVRGYLDNSGVSVPTSYSGDKAPKNAPVGALFYDTINNTLSVLTQKTDGTTYWNDRPGLVFTTPSTATDKYKIEINRSIGIKITAGTSGVYFGVNNNTLGFFDNSGTAKIYMDGSTGNGVFTGTITAKDGLLGPWTIGQNGIYFNSSDAKTSMLFYSFENTAYFCLGAGANSDPRNWAYFSISNDNSMTNTQVSTTSSSTSSKVKLCWDSSKGTTIVKCKILCEESVHAEDITSGSLSDKLNELGPYFYQELRLNYSCETAATNKKILNLHSSFVAIYGGGVNGTSTKKYPIGNLEILDYNGYMVLSRLKFTGTRTNFAIRGAGTICFIDCQFNGRILAEGAKIILENCTNTSGGDLPSKTVKLLHGADVRHNDGTKKTAPLAEVLSYMEVKGEATSA